MNAPARSFATRPIYKTRQQGAALVVGLILLLVLTLLAVSGMNTATLELRMAGNNQFSQNAFQAAESGIETALTNWVPGTVYAPGPITDPDSGDTFDVTVTTNPDNGETDLPNGSIGVGTGAPRALHYDIVSTGTTNQDATSTHTQSFYIPVPGL